MPLEFRFPFPSQPTDITVEAALDCRIEKKRNN